jgi:putative endonuclease
MAYFVYAISATSRNYIYVGITDNIERRFNEHNNGYNKTTKPYAPFVLIYTEECASRVDARIREKYFKSTVGKRELRKLLKNNAARCVGSSLPAYEGRQACLQQVNPIIRTLKAAQIEKLFYIRGLYLFSPTS